MAKVTRELFAMLDPHTRAVRGNSRGLMMRTTAKKARQLARAHPLPDDDTRQPIARFVLAPSALPMPPRCGGCRHFTKDPDEEPCCRCDGLRDGLHSHYTDWHDDDDPDADEDGEE